MYKIDFLVKTFLKHAETAQENWIKDRKMFKKMNPKEPLPDHYKEDFNLPLALATICDCIRHLNERLKEMEDAQ
jgi:hypothetical protein